MIWWRGLVVSSSPATDETGAMGREIESRQGMHREVVFLEKNCCGTTPFVLCDPIRKGSDKN
jgi:hypothetical protein